MRKPANITTPDGKPFRQVFLSPIGQIASNFFNIANELTMTFTAGDSYKSERVSLEGKTVADVKNELYALCTQNGCTADNAPLPAFNLPVIFPEEGGVIPELQTILENAKDKPYYEAYKKAFETQFSFAPVVRSFVSGKDVPSTKFSMIEYSDDNADFRATVEDYMNTATSYESCFFKEASWASILKIKNEQGVKIVPSELKDTKRMFASFKLKRPIDKIDDRFLEGIHCIKQSLDEKFLPYPPNSLKAGSLIRVSFAIAEGKKRGNFYVNVNNVEFIADGELDYKLMEVSKDYSKDFSAYKDSVIPMQGFTPVTLVKSEPKSKATAQGIEDEEIPF